jgi:hypothetical protein
MYKVIHLDYTNQTSCVKNMYTYGTTALVKCREVADDLSTQTETVRQDGFGYVVMDIGTREIQHRVYVQQVLLDKYPEV